MGALVSSLERRTSARSRWTRFSTSKPAACSKCGPNLYGLTGEREHLDLIERYDRRRFFDPLVAGEDVLTNMHMNTTIPEVHGAAPRVGGHR